MNSFDAPHDRRVAAIRGERGWFHAGHRRVFASAELERRLCDTMGLDHPRAQRLADGDEAWPACGDELDRDSLVEWMRQVCGGTVGRVSHPNERALRLERRTPLQPISWPPVPCKGDFEVESVGEVRAYHDQRENHEASQATERERYRTERAELTINTIRAHIPDY